jgi:hypothetical protein
VKSASGTTSIARSYGSGSTKVATIPSGQLYSGRLSGGGTRSSIFGSRFAGFTSSLTNLLDTHSPLFTRQYGSGYPGISTPGVAGRGFPFGFWPVTFGGAAGAGVNNRYRSDEVCDTVARSNSSYKNLTPSIVWRSNQFLTSRWYPSRCPIPTSGWLKHIPYFV